jgi:hypothetical protein
MFDNDRSQKHCNDTHKSVESIDLTIKRLQRKAEICRILNKAENKESKSLVKEFFEGVNID